jgi:hypothetical protein
MVINYFITIINHFVIFVTDISVKIRIITLSIREKYYKFLIKNRKNIVAPLSLLVIGSVTTIDICAEEEKKITPYQEVCLELNKPVGNLSQQENFKLICNKIFLGPPNRNDSKDDEAIAALRHEEVAVQGNASLESSRKHASNVTQRINVLRQSTKGGASGDDNGLLESSRWGFFTNVGYNKGDRRKTVEVDGAGGLGDATKATVKGERAFDFDGKELSIGLDYRLPGEKIIIGGALGYNKLNSHFTAQSGNTKLNGRHLSVYGSYLPTNKIYIDGIVSVGNNAIKGSRPLPVYDKTTETGETAEERIGTGDVDITGKALADTNSHQLSASIGMGYEFNRNALNITPYTRFDYTKTDIDAYTETVLDNNPLGRDSRGMALSINKQRGDSLIGVIGIRTSYPMSSSGGVFVPQASVELNRQLKTDERSINAAPLLGILNIDAPRAETSELDRTYLKLGLGVSALFPNGHSGFIQIESLQASNDLSDTAIKAGYKLEF